MNKYLKKKIIRYLALLIALITTLVLSVVILIKDDYFKDIVNSCRVLASDELYNISNAYEDGTYKNIEGKYTYTIISLDGQVIKSTEKDALDKVSIKNVSFDNWYDVKNSDVVRYSSPIVINEKIENIVIFTIPKEDIVNIRNDKKSLLYYVPILLIILGILLVIYKIYKIINNDILGPINEMHKSASEILKGNYLTKVIYDYHGEIGEFSHDFEKMRDSLMVARDKEEKLKIAEKELLACISHDLKTPIANISGYCEGIIDGVVKEEKDVKRYAGIILKKSKVLTKLLDDVLELSKAEINQMSINKQEIYSREFFTALVEEISMDVISNNREFIIEGEIPNLLINLDKDRIGQVIGNIVANSIKYTNVGGIINMKFKKLQDVIEISIKDNGIGIATEELQFVFNKFYRGEKHRNQNIPGSGLGLSISKYIIEMHKGNIEMISQKEIGTTVIFTIKN
ncbi:MAG: HAMP domain-containing sensor histidine kinase [Clostridium sp.]